MKDTNEQYLTTCENTVYLHHTDGRVRCVFGYDRSLSPTDYDQDALHRHIKTSDWIEAIPIEQLIHCPVIGV